MQEERQKKTTMGFGLELFLQPYNQERDFGNVVVVILGGNKQKQKHEQKEQELFLLTPKNKKPIRHFTG